MIKKMFIILGLCFFCMQAVQAEEANQEINLQDNKAVISLQKQPTDEKSSQRQAVRNNWFCVVVQVNGKIKGSDTNNK